MHKSQSTDCKRILDRSFQEEIDIREVYRKSFLESFSNNILHSYNNKMVDLICKSKSFT